jgi:hypothetical protein
VRALVAPKQTIDSKESPKMKSYLAMAASAACAFSLTGAVFAEDTTPQYSSQMQRHERTFDIRTMESWSNEDRFEFLTRNVSASDRWAIRDVMMRLPSNHAHILRKAVVTASTEGLHMAQMRRTEMMRTQPGTVTTQTIRTETIGTDTRRTDVVTRTEVVPPVHTDRTWHEYMMRREDPRPGLGEVLDRVMTNMNATEIGVLTRVWNRLTWREQDAFLNVVRDSYNPRSVLWLPIRTY